MSKKPYSNCCSIQRVLAWTFCGAPFAPCLLTLADCPRAAVAADLAFSAFFFDSAAAFFSLPSLTAWARAAARAAGAIDRFSLMTSREAPTIARWCLTVFRVRFLVTSSERPFLCIRRYKMVQAILRGFFLCRNRLSLFPFENRKLLLSPLTKSLPFPG